MGWKLLLRAGVAHLTGVAICLAQTSPHHFGAMQQLPGGPFTILLAGSAPTSAISYFDIYPLESSTDLVSWSPQTTLLRTNKSTAALIYADADGNRHGARFYRMPTNHLITPLPVPSGPLRVGTTSMLLTDPSRSNRYNVKTNSSFMITLWFPTPAVSGVLPDFYLESKMAPSFAGLYGISSTLLATFRSHSYSASVVAKSGGPLPVIIYSPGFKVDRRDNTAKFEELASHGYVVVSIDHADCLATVFPDGRLLSTSISGLSASLYQDDILDMRFVLDTLTRMNSEDPFFMGTMDLDRIGTMGWSFGGGVAAEICRTDSRVLATVLLDAYLQNADDLLANRLQKPLIGMYNIGGANKMLFNPATHDAYWMQIQNTQHQHFADWLAWLSSPNDSGRRAAVAMNACMLSFFNKYLKDEDDHLLDDPAKVFPEIANFAKK